MSTLIKCNILMLSLAKGLTAWGHRILLSMALKTIMSTVIVLMIIDQAGSFGEKIKGK